MAVWIAVEPVRNNNTTLLHKHYTVNVSKIIHTTEHGRKHSTLTLSGLKNTTFTIQFAVGILGECNIPTK